MATQDKNHLLYICARTAAPCVQAYVWEKEDILHLLNMADLVPSQILQLHELGLTPLHVTTVPAPGKRSDYPGIDEDQWASGLLHVTLRLRGDVIGTFLSADAAQRHSADPQDGAA